MIKISEQIMGLLLDTIYNMKNIHFKQVYEKILIASMITKQQDQLDMHIKLILNGELALHMEQHL